MEPLQGSKGPKAPHWASPAKLIGWFTSVSVYIYGQWQVIPNSESGSSMHGAPQHHDLVDRVEHKTETKQRKRGKEQKKEAMSDHIYLSIYIYIYIYTERERESNVQLLRQRTRVFAASTPPIPTCWVSNQTARKSTLTLRLSSLRTSPHHLPYCPRHNWHRSCPWVRY